MRKLVYILLLLSFFTGIAHAQEKFVYEDSTLLQRDDELQQVEVVPAPDDQLSNYDPDKPDTTLYPNSLAISPDSLREWKKLKKYAYINYLDSLLKHRKRQEVKSAPRSPGLLNDFLGSGFFSALLWILAILFVGFIIYRLFLADSIFKRSSKSVANETTEVTEEEVNSGSDFDKLINTSLQHGNFRQAVRYQYLRSLHALADKGLVELAPDKTNYQYVSELRNRDLQQPFAAITLNYEYVWYGEFNIDREIYQKIEPGFTGFNQKLQSIP